MPNFSQKYGGNCVKYVKDIVYNYYKLGACKSDVYMYTTSFLIIKKDAF